MRCEQLLWLPTTVGVGNHPCRRTE